MKIKKVTILANTSKENIKKVASEMVSFFNEKGIENSLVILSSTEDDYKIEIPDCDLAVSLGGDGTVLTCAGIVNNKKIPLLAVNMGTFGYIAETAVSEFKSVFEDYIKGRTKAQERIRLNAEVVRKKKVVFEGSALNEITVSSASRAKTAKLNLSIDGIFAAGLKCDGIIIATPTGSTAYNLSSGGPIIEETLHNIIVNPICSFTLSARPLVIDEKSVVEIEIPEQASKTVVSCDGHEAFYLKKDDVVRIKRSKYPTLLVKNNKRNSIEVLRDKLGWAGGFNA